MKPWETLDTAPAPGGGELVLARRGEEYAIRVGGHVLMTSRTHGSEEALAEHGCAPLAGRPLEDARVTVVEADVFAVLRDAAARPFDAVLLDVDNGPVALTRPENARLYGGGGLALARGALKPGGVLVVWSAAPDAAFGRRLRDAGLEAQVVEVPARGGAGGARHVLFLGRHPGAPRG